MPAQNTIVHAAGTGWIDRVSANGGTAPSAALIEALDIFCNALDADGLTSLMKAVVVFSPGEVTPAVAAGDLIRALTPLIANAGNDPWTNVGPFVPGDLTINGLLGNGTTKYLRTGILPNAVFASAASGGLTFYHYLYQHPTANGNDFGVQNIGKNFQLISSYQGVSYFDSWNATTGRMGVPCPLRLHGYYSGNRTSLTEAQIYYASHLVPHYSLGTNANDVTGQPLPAAEIGFFCLWDSTVPFGICVRRSSFAAVHEGLTTTQSSNFYDAIQQLRLRLGGGYW